MALHQSKGVRSFHNNVFITLEQVAFNLFHPDYHTDFKKYQRTEGMPYQPDRYDYSIWIYDKKRWKRAPVKSSVKPISKLNSPLDNSSIGPILLLLALIIATPVSWKRKILYSFIGIFLVYILIALKYSYMMYENLDNYEAHGLWGMLSTTFGNAFRSHEFLLMNVVFIWVLICIRSKEFKWFMK